ncbi:MAG: D-alanyl-D-alanine carboxypeptidase [Eubacteriales Family XIII. Incertae Sedis bacterium]|nr:MAG: D-alanyl-D-alanine carboxypeptidase [Clostridiales Family XIII bacterium]
MGSLYRYIKNKSKRINKAVCLCLVAALFVGGGFMGINSFKAEQRSLDATDGEGRTVSLDILTSGNAAIESESGVKQNQGGEGVETAPAAGAMTIDAKSAVLMDAASGKVLFAQNENEQLPPASVTKVMTMLLVLEAVDSGKISLDDTVTISERAASMGGSQMYMEVGEQHTLEEIMKGVAMVSANDGCVAAAEYLCGSVEIFVENMNKRAAELGMQNTNFVNTNGLPAANHYSSAYDIALMSRELMKHIDGHTWFTTWQDKIMVGLPGKQTEFGLTNTNKLIKQYPGAIGLKTGYTSDAGYCLSGAATRDNTTLIAVVMGCKTTDIRLKEISKLLDYGFANYDTAIVAEKDQVMGEILLEKGSPEKINAVAAEKQAILVGKGEAGSVTSSAVIWDTVELPLAAGDQVGELSIFKGEEEIAKVPLVAEKSADKVGIIEIYRRMLLKLVK